MQSLAGFAIRMPGIVQTTLVHVYRDPGSGYGDRLRHHDLQRYPERSLGSLPVHQPGKVVTFYIHDTTDSRPFGRSAFKVAEFLEYQEQNHVFEEVIGGANEDVLFAAKEGTELFDGAYITPNTFRFLGVPALLGRTTTPDDGKPGAPPVFVMAYKLWVKRFNSDPSILGQSFILNGVPTTLVGIMPRRFTKRGADLWRVQTLDRSSPEVAQQYFLFQARLKPGVTLQQVEADINSIAHRLAQTNPKDYPKLSTFGRRPGWIAWCANSGQRSTPLQPPLDCCC